MFENLREAIASLSANECRVTARAFAHFLNVSNTLEQLHKLKDERASSAQDEKEDSGISDAGTVTLFSTIQRILGRLHNEGGGSATVPPEQLVFDALRQQLVELVLTAHPTEVNRRSLLLKQARLMDVMQQRDAHSGTPQEEAELLRQLQHEIATIWATDELRRAKPSPVDEAIGGLYVVEQSLWSAVAAIMRKVDYCCRELLGGRRIGHTDSPLLRFGSWMGGDRDGNPFVTAEVTLQVSLLGRWMAADLLLADVRKLRADLSVSGNFHQASPEVLKLAAKGRSAHGTPANTRGGGLGSAGGEEPYRDALRWVEHRLANTRDAMEAQLDELRPSSQRAKNIMASTATRLHGSSGGGGGESAPPYMRKSELQQDLTALYDSLYDANLPSVADGPLLDTIRRVAAFGLTLLPLDLRQDSARHTQALDELTALYTASTDGGNDSTSTYGDWDEAQRVHWLLRELQSRRPLIVPSMLDPHSSPFSEPVREVLNTFRVAAQMGPEAVSTYIISMAKTPSDVLAVELLQREVARGCGHGVDGLSRTADQDDFLVVVPLFETLADLQSAPATMQALLNLPWYSERLRRARIGGERPHDAATHPGGFQMVMIGYSDSSKDAGRMAAAWALFRAQEELVNLFSQRDLPVRLALFHGKGGSVGRGGGTQGRGTHRAILAQPEGSVDGLFRATEQGEMINAQFGNPHIAASTLETYLSAVLEATFAPPPPPTPEWRAAMDLASAKSCDAYRSVVYNNDDFVKYFHLATPAHELAAMNIGSRPARRPALAKGGAGGGGQGSSDGDMVAAAVAAGGVSSLRAIPWVFAWTQTRHHLPTWLGVPEGLAALGDDAQAMYAEWPFFEQLVDLIDMVLSKATTEIVANYDEQLLGDQVPPQLINPAERAKLVAIGSDLRQRLDQASASVLEASGRSFHIEGNDALRSAMAIRNRYIDPLNVLQAEVLSRLRYDTAETSEKDKQLLHDTLMLTINGVAAGMRNTG